MKGRLFLLGILISLVVHADYNLSVVSLYGLETNCKISLIGQIRFEDKTVCLYDKGGIVLGCTAVDEINKIIFGSIDDTSTDFETTPQSVRVFPSPTLESLVISGLQDMQIVRIYNVKGQLIKSEIASNGEAYIYVGELPDATYLLQIGAQVVKFIKE